MLDPYSNPWRNPLKEPYSNNLKALYSILDLRISHPPQVISRAAAAVHSARRQIIARTLQIDMKCGPVRVLDPKP